MISREATAWSSRVDDPDSTTFGAALTLFPSAMTYFADKGVELSQALLG